MNESDIIEGLKKEDRGAEKAWLGVRREDYSFGKRAQQILQKAFQDKLMPLAKITNDLLRKHKRACERPDELVDTILSGFCANVQQQEDKWKRTLGCSDRGLDDEWNRVLSKILPRNGRNSLFRVLESYADECCRQKTGLRP